MELLRFLTKVVKINDEMQVIVSFRTLIFSKFRNKIWTPDLEIWLNFKISLDFNWLEYANFNGRFHRQVSLNISLAMKRIRISLKSSNLNWNASTRFFGDELEGTGQPPSGERHLLTSCFVSLRPCASSYDFIPSLVEPSCVWNTRSEYSDLVFAIWYKWLHYLSAGGC